MIVGITGGIGSGKTIISKLFETFGCKIYYSDDRAKAIYLENHVKQSVTKLLGANAYLLNGDLNKDYISEKIFNDSELLDKLNNIIHPEVQRDFDLFCKQFPKSIIIKEAAILFETGLYKELDATILVCAPTEIKIQRVEKRSKLSVQEIKKRMSNQWSDEKKIPLATYIIHNDEQQAIIPQALKVYMTLKNK